MKNMENISNSDFGKCEKCGKEATRDWNNKDKKKVCEDCWYELGYHNNTCYCCGRVIKGAPVELELSNTDNKFYETIPEGHISQGFFDFGKTCAKKMLKMMKNG